MLVMLGFVPHPSLRGLIRLVCGGQTVAPAVSLSGLSLSCPGTLNAGASASCSATASYSDGSSKAVSPAWSSSNPTALSVNSGGSLAAGTPGTDTIVTLSASYSEGGMSKTATTTVTVKAAAAKLTGLAANCPATLNAGSSAACTATASYSNGTSNSVSATWTSSNTSTASVNGNTITGGNVTTDTPVSLNASYTENGVTQTATAMVLVKAAVATLSSLELICPASMTSSSSGNCSAQAVYSDGKKTVVSSGTWTVTPSGTATVDATGMVTASKVTADTPITVNVSYTENGKTVTDTKTITIKAAACLANTGEITISGAAVKKLGESLDVRYRLCNFNKATNFDVYVAVQIPTGDLLFLSSSGNFFGIPTFTPWDGKNKPAAYLASTLVPDLEGSVLSMSVLPLTLPTGTYTFYAIPVLKGADVMNGFNWVGSLASGAVTLGK